MKSWILKYTGEKKSGLGESPQSDTEIFKFMILLDGREFNVGIRVAGITIGQIGEQEVLRILYDRIGDVIFKHGDELKDNTTYRLVDYTLEKEK